jgi:hypothetical protein
MEVKYIKGLCITQTKTNRVAFYENRILSNKTDPDIAEQWK